MKTPGLCFPSADPSKEVVFDMYTTAVILVYALNSHNDYQSSCSLKGNHSWFRLPC